MDFAILTTLLSEKTKNKILVEVTSEENSDAPFLVKAHQIIKKLLSRSISSSFSPEEYVRLVRFNLRIGLAISENEWIREFQTTDPIMNYYQKLLDSKTDIKKVNTELQTAIRDFNPENDAEGFIGKLTLLSIIVQVLGYLGDLEQSRKVLEDARAVIREMKKNELADFVFGQILTSIAWWERERGDISVAERLQNELFEIATSINSDILRGSAYGIIGAFYSQQGIIRKAMSNYQMSRDIREKLGDKIRALRMSSSMAWDIMALGKPRQAVRLLEEIRRKYIRLNGEENVPPHITRFMGEILLLAGEVEKAYQYIKEAFEKQASLSGEDSYGTNIARKSLIEALIERGELTKAKERLDKLYQFCEKSPSDYLYAGYYYSFSNYQLKTYNLGLALENIFEALEYASKPGNYDMLLKTQLTITKIYIQQYKLSEDVHLLINALNFIENIIQATKEQEYRFLLWRSLVIRSNIEFLLERNKEAMKSLQEALAIVEDDSEAKIVITENITELETKIKQQIKLEDKRESLLRRISKNIQEAFKFVFVKRPVEIEFTLHGLLIIKDSGIPLYSKIINDDIISDDILLTGLITAINDFSSHLFSRTNTGALSSIVHENLNILLEKENGLLIALIVDKNTFELRTKMLQFIQDLQINVLPESSEQRKKELIEQKFQYYFT
ncbi:MAG: hypothetical protein GF308_21625 [Candidatus Heimdallarchaeota archaeon]|nr:hypothetical protein [Candidatus Heimdallarchaeota archaeon]